MFVVALALPISSYSLNIIESNDAIKTQDDEFTNKVKACNTKIGVNDKDYLQCLYDEAQGLNDPFDHSKTSCCSRVLNYECMKILMTPKCGFSKEEIQSHDEELFNYWNDFNDPQYPGNCKGNRTESLTYCNGFSKITVSLTLQIASVFILSLFVFSKI